MKKIICLITALILCLSIAAPAYAAESDFVPSITYKPNPEIVPVKGEDGNEYIGVIRDEEGNALDYVDHSCLNITPVAHVWDEEITLPVEVENLLVFVYESLHEGDMKLPYEKLGDEVNAANMVIRDLFDARWACEEHRAMIEDAGILFEITFDLGVDADVEIFAMTYDEQTEEWSPVVKTVNNGDGTVTCTFEHLCAISFSMPLAATGVAAEGVQSLNILPWIIALIVAAAGAFFIILLVGKKKKKESAV